MSKQNKLYVPLWTQLRQQRDLLDKKQKELKQLPDIQSSRSSSISVDILLLRSKLQEGDKQLHALLQTGALVLKYEKSLQDITRATRIVTRQAGELSYDDIEPFDFPKPTETLVWDIKKRVESLRQTHKLALQLLAELERQSELGLNWKAFQENQYDVISLLFENVYHAPSKLKQKDLVASMLRVNSETLQKAETLTKLGNTLQQRADAFFQELTPDKLRTALKLKCIALETAFANPLVSKLAQVDSISNQADEILGFWRIFLSEINAIQLDAQKLRLNAFQVANFPFENAKIEAESAGIMAYVQFEELLWNGTFSNEKEFFIDSILATLYAFTKHAVPNAIRTIKKYDADELDNHTNLARIEESQQFIDSLILIQTHRPLFNAWLTVLDQLSRKEITVQTFLDYAVRVSPRDKRQLVEDKFYAELADNERYGNDKMKQQGRVRDGRNKAVREFNRLFFNSSAGLVFMGSKELQNETLLQAASQGVQLKLLFTDNFRLNISELELTNEQRLNFLLESLQDSHILINLL